MAGNKVTAALAASVLILGGVQVNDMVKADGEKDKIIRTYTDQRDSIMIAKKKVFGDLRVTYQTTRHISGKDTAYSRDSVVTTAALAPTIHSETDGSYLSVAGDTVKISAVLSRGGKDSTLRYFAYPLTAGKSMVLSHKFLPLK